jgi:hypothetical protein
LMQKRNTSPIDTGRRPKRKVGDIGVPKDWWDIARDLYFCRILSEDPYPVDVDKLSEESYKEAHEILSSAIKEFDVSKAAIHRVSIRMFQALLSSTDDQARGSPISCQSGLR